MGLYVLAEFPVLEIHYLVPCCWRVIDDIDRIFPISSVTNHLLKYFIGAVMYEDSIFDVKVFCDSFKYV
jgi:hypothetical protein